MNQEEARPANVTDVGLWKLVRAVRDRHQRDDYAGTCRFCAESWPCEAEQRAALADSASRRPLGPPMPGSEASAELSASPVELAPPITALAPPLTALDSPPAEAAGVAGLEPSEPAPKTPALRRVVRKRTDSATIVPRADASSPVVIPRAKPDSAVIVPRPKADSADTTRPKARPAVRRQARPVPAVTVPQPKTKPAPKSRERRAG
jgi:hypothetical protein